MLRIGLFLLTNLAVIALAAITMSLLGFEGYMARNGVDLNLTALLIFCFIIGMGGAFVSLLLSKWMAKRFTGTQIIEQPSNPTEQWLLDTVKELSARAGIRMPEVGIFPAQQSNAFATGWNKNQALVAVSSGLLSRFSREEVKAVMAHEIGHVANGDMVTLALIQGVVNTFVMFFARVIGHTVDRVVFKTERGHGIGFYVVTFVAEILLGFIAAMIVAWFSRRREYRADDFGARLAGSNAMIGALARLKAEVELPNQMPDTMTAFGITEGKVSLASLLASHPPLEQRIKALQK